MLSHTRDVAVPPVVDPKRWEDFEGFRETLLSHFTTPKHNAALRSMAGVLYALINETADVMPKPPEGWYRTRVRAALADLRFLQGFLALLGDDSETYVPQGDDKLFRIVGRKAVALGKLADAIEAALARPAEGGE